MKYIDILLIQIMKKILDGLVKVTDLWEQKILLILTLFQFFSLHYSYVLYPIFM